MKNLQEVNIEKDKKMSAPINCHDNPDRRDVMTILVVVPLALLLWIMALALFHIKDVEARAEAKPSCSTIETWYAIHW